MVVGVKNEEQGSIKKKIEIDQAFPGGIQANKINIIGKSIAVGRRTEPHFQLVLRAGYGQDTRSVLS